MGWSRRWIFSSKDRWQTVLGALRDWEVDFAHHPVEVIVRDPKKEKTPEQRALFHAIVGDIAKTTGETPAAIKLRIKGEFYGVEVTTTDGVVAMLVPESEDSDREEYSRLINFSYQWAARRGISLVDRRPQRQHL